MNKLKTLPQYCVPQKLLSALAGKFANQNKLHQLAIKWFIKHYQVNMAEALESDPSHYSSFNEFFIRQLKPDVRSFDMSDEILSSPVDGRISQLGKIESGRIIQAKGRHYSMRELIGGNLKDAEQFDDGQFCTLYLSPKDYHRIHMPCKGTLTKMIYLPGKLFAVKPSAVNSVPNLFARNERLAIFFDTAHGPMCVVMVGAMIVGAMATHWQGLLPRSKEPRIWQYPNAAVSETNYSKKDELGYFQLGSTVVLLMSQQAQLQWHEAHQQQSPILLGQTLGRFK